MIRMLVTLCIFLASAAVGLIVAVIALPGVTIDLAAFLLDIVIFAVVRALVSPLLLKATIRNASAIVGAVGLLATLVALIVTHVVSDGLSISGLSAWVGATLIVWLVSMFVALLLPFLILKGLLGAWLQKAAQPPAGKGGKGGDTLSQAI